MTRFITLCCFIFLVTAVAVAQDETGDCPAIVETALQTTLQVCDMTGRNEACYGHVAMSAEPQPDATNFDFAVSGDIVNAAAIRTLRTSPLDTTAGTWGVALFRLQADLPDTSPGQNVTILMFGDSEISNAADSVASQSTIALEMQVAGSSGINVRVGPGTDRAVITSLSGGTIIVATGRLPDNSWVRIQLPENPDQSGWVFAELLTTDGDINTLNVVEPGAVSYGPMQAFYLSTGIGEPQCREVPGDGILVQSPQGTQSITLTVNEVQIELGSTAYLTANPGQTMTVNTLNGFSRMTANGRSRTAPAGSRLSVPIDEELHAIDVPGDPETYSDEIFDALPIDNLDYDFEIESPLTDDEIYFLENYGTVLDHVNFEDIDDVWARFGDVDFDCSAGGEDCVPLGFRDIMTYLTGELGYGLNDFDDDPDFMDFIGDELGDEYDDFFGDDDFGDDDFGDDDFGDDDFGDDDFGDDDFGDDDFGDDDFGDDDFGDDDFGDEEE